ncbi:hypothetical protein IPL68_07270 [Candidatus Saccharibacteria bacterium]|nr:MAG: hypothetical protein IPL68_07270 [Candidatus Saccharibacteria bacterium]
MTHAAYSAALLSKLGIDAVDEQLGRNARGLLKEYSNNVSPEHWDEVKKYLHDFSIVSDYGESHVSALAPLDQPSLRSRKTKKKLPKEGEHGFGRIDAMQMDAILDVVTLDSVVIMAARSLATGLVSEAQTSKSIIHNARLSDLFYAQVTSFIGKDAFTMALRNNEKRLLLEHPERLDLFIATKKNIQSSLVGVMKQLAI